MGKIWGAVMPPEDLYTMVEIAHTTCHHLQQKAIKFWKSKHSQSKCPGVNQKGYRGNSGLVSDQL
jgi:hypothetical protein